MFVELKAVARIAPEGFVPRPLFPVALSLSLSIVLSSLAWPALATAQTSAPAATPTAPLAIHVGDADLLIGGFLDATSVTRSTNTGAVLGTVFGTIPFATGAAGQLSETRLSAQNSRLSLMATSQAGHVAMKGYVEADFGGAAPANVMVTSNGNTFRMRLFWAQATAGNVEFLAGQSWSLATPGRNGISPAPGDIFFTQLVDTNYQSGLVWNRTAQFRIVAHPSNRVAAALSIENPQQYVGSAVTLPAAFTAAELDNGSNAGAPNLMPDIIGKVAVDTPTGDTRQHVEVMGLVRQFKTWDATSTSTMTATATGGGLNVNLEPVKGVHLIGNSFFSKGGGRYLANTNIPDLIVNGDSSMTLVSNRSLMGGIEAAAGTKTTLFGYHSQVTATAATTTDPATGKAIGFGVAGQTAANKDITETSVGFNYAFFKDAKIGSLQLMAQFSSVTRTPFSVPTGTPANASAKLFYVNVRFVLP